MKKELRVEIHIVKRTKQFNIMFKQSKAAYNVANYVMRQAFDYRYWKKKNIEEYDKRYREYFKDKMLYYKDLNKICKSKLPAQCHQQILKLVERDWKSFYWLKQKQKWKKLPWYKQNEFMLIFTNQNINEKWILMKTLLNYKINTKLDKKIIKEIRIIPYDKEKMKIEIVYEVLVDNLNIKEWKKAWLDIWLNNICTLITEDWKTCIINWKQIKSINCYFNKKIAKINSISKSHLKEQVPKNKLKKLYNKRNRKINYYLHQTSKLVIKFLNENNVTELVIWKNIWIKHESKLKKFIQIPHNYLINMITYKFNWNVYLTEESYTSKIDHLAYEPLEKQDTYLWKRIHRWLFKSSTWKSINSDINWALWILRKKYWDWYIKNIIKNWNTYWNTFLPSKKLNLKAVSKYDIIK